MDKIAGTIMSFNTEGVPYFLVEQPDNCRFVIAEYEEEMTNLGVILKKLKSLNIQTEQLSLMDLVDISYEHQHHTPLFVFSIEQTTSLPTVPAPYCWVNTQEFRRILGNVTLEDIAGLTF